MRYAQPLIGSDWVSVPLVNGIQRFARLEPLFADIDEFMSHISCAFIGERYFSLKVTMCQDIATSFIMLSLCFFMNSFEYG